MHFPFVFNVIHTIVRYSVKPLFPVLICWTYDHDEWINFGSFLVYKTIGWLLSEKCKSIHLRYIPQLRRKEPGWSRPVNHLKQCKKYTVESTRSYLLKHLYSIFSPVDLHIKGLPGFSSLLCPQGTSLSKTIHLWYIPQFRRKELGWSHARRNFADHAQSTI